MYISLKAKGLRTRQMSYRMMSAMSTRQKFYKKVSAGELDNTQKAYQQFLKKEAKSRRKKKQTNREETK